MLLKGVGADVALDTVRAAREDPNLGFILALMEFERQVMGFERRGGAAWTPVRPGIPIMMHLNEPAGVGAGDARQTSILLQWYGD
eukprot:gene54342-10063_t